MKAIRLKRFKGFEDSNWIQLSGISLLFGLNSSGKTSILNALFMLKQSLENPAFEIPFTFSMRKGVDIGTYKEAIHNGIIDNTKPIELWFRVDISEEVEAHKVSVNTTELEIRIKIGFIQKYEQLVVLSFYVEDAINNKKIFSYHINPRSFDYFITADIDDPYLLNDLISDGVEWDNFLPYIDIPELKENTVKLLLDIVRKKTSTFFDTLVHIGPLRSEFGRFHQFSGERPNSVGISGEEALKMLYLDRHNKGELTKNVQMWLKRMFNYDYHWSSYKGLFELLFKTKDGGSVNAKDVGFGVSQILPVIIQGYYPINQCIVIEQPEIHLHPRAQAELADLFLDIIEKTNKSMLIETHSEHILLRLRRRIIENTLKKYTEQATENKEGIENKISINFIEYKKERASFHILV
ncbi:AAA family ATPase [Paenibacillus sp. 1A_MP2]|uniref:AAA family ATPase n=1 Tax=Paenibacillus sp. 1A_MP2 TaxID=3457495 RepID=UPI003FCCAB40